VSSTTDLLAGLPALLPERLLEEAQAITGGPAALYLVDISGTALRRVAGSAGLPGEVPLVCAIGPEFGADGLDELRARVRTELQGAVVAPLWLRRRATGVLIAAQGPLAELERLAEAAAPAFELARGYTDVFDRGRRHRPATPAAEVQQDLLAPRMVAVSGAEVAGGLMPAYDVGGDWFDHAENPDGVWLGVADAVGRGTQAAAVSAVAIGAFRAARRASAGLEECCATIDDAVSRVERRQFVTAVLATWHASTHTFTWVNCGHPLPLLIGRDGDVIQLDGGGTHPLGLWSTEGRVFPRNQRRLEVGDRLLIYSDGVTDRRTADGGLIGLDGLIDLVGRLRGASAAETVIAIETHVRQVSEDALSDDATQLVLSVTD
jgi:serine phosphatase RsbU (regulator of sigma subunit)